MTEEKLRLGGMALRNGLLVHGPTHWAAAVRDDDGNVVVGSGRKPRVRAADDVPGVRGVVRLGEAFAVIPLVKRGLPQAKLPFENPSVLGVAATASLAGALARRRLRGISGEAVAATISLAPAVLALRGGELAAYHGVEHKAIAAYESDAPDAADAAKEHDRCGSHLVTPLLASNLAGALLMKRVLEKPGPMAGAGVARGVDRGGRRGVRLVRAQRRLAARPRAAPSGLRAAAADRHARAGRAPARGRPRGARGDPAGRNSAVRLGSRPQFRGTDLRGDTWPRCSVIGQQLQERLPNHSQTVRAVHAAKAGEGGGRGPAAGAVGVEPGRGRHPHLGAAHVHGADLSSSCGGR